MKIRLKFPIGQVETWNPPAPLVQVSTTRHAFLRGVEVLHLDERERYAARMARFEHLGSHSLMADEARKGLRNEALRTLAVDRIARRRRTSQRAMFPSAYRSPAFTGRGSVMSDVLVKEDDASRYEHEARADLFLLWHGEPNRGLDFTRQGHLQIEPDAAAYRGAERAKRQPSARYATGGTVDRANLNDGEYEGAFAVDSLGTVTLPAITYRTIAVGRGYGWQGHRKIIGTVRHGHVKRTTRVGATGKRGKVVHYFSASPRSIPRMWQKATDEQKATCDTLVSILLTSIHNQAFHLGDVPTAGADGVNHHWVIVDTERKTVRRSHWPVSQALNVRDYARRAALAGLVID